MNEAAPATTTAARRGAQMFPTLEPAEMERLERLARGAASRRARRSLAPASKDMASCWCSQARWRSPSRTRRGASAA